MRTEPWRKAGAVLGALLLLAVLHQAWQYRAQLDVSLAPSRWPWIGAALLCFGVAQLAFAVAWHRLMRDHGGTGGLRGDVTRWFVTVAGKYLPGKVWQGLARVGLYHRAGAKTGAASAFLREVLLTVSAASTLVALHSALAGGARTALALPMLGCAIAALLLALPASARLLAMPVSRLSKGRVRWEHGGTAGALQAWALHLLAYLALGAGFLALGVGITGLPAQLGFALTAALCFGGVAGIAALFAPAGLGVREAALAWYLLPWIGPGPAAMLAIAARVWLTVGDLLLVSVGLWMLRTERQGPPD